MDGIGVSWLIQVGLSLLLVAGLFVAFSHFLKKFSVTAGVATGQGELFCVIKKQPFDGRNSIVLIRCQEKEYLLFGHPEKMMMLDSWPASADDGNQKGQIPTK